MKNFAKILIATLLGSFTFTFLFFSLASIAEGHAGFLWLSFPGSAIGMLMFGITGSLLWFIFMSIFGLSTLRETKKHLISAFIASFFCSVPLFLISENSFNIKTYGTSLVFTIPTSIFSYLIYRAIYLRDKANT